MGKIIPDDIIIGDRSEQARELIVKRYFMRIKKSQIIAYVLWFLLGVVGAHRFYLKQWKQGGLLILLFIAVSLLSASYEVQGYLNLSSSDISISYFFRLILIVVFLAEGLFLYSRVKKSNQSIRDILLEDVGLNYD